MTAFIYMLVVQVMHCRLSQKPPELGDFTPRHPPITISGALPPDFDMTAIYLQHCICRNLFSSFYIFSKIKSIVFL